MAAISSRARARFGNGRISVGSGRQTAREYNAEPGLAGVVRSIFATRVAAKIALVGGRHIVEFAPVAGNGAHAAAGIQAGNPPRADLLPRCAMATANLAAAVDRGWTPIMPIEQGAIACAALEGKHRRDAWCGTHGTWRCWPGCARGGMAWACRQRRRCLDLKQLLAHARATRHLLVCDVARAIRAFVHALRMRQANRADDEDEQHGECAGEMSVHGACPRLRCCSGSPRQGGSASVVRRVGV